MIEISRTDPANLVSISPSHWNNPNGRAIDQVNVITAINGNTVTVRNPLFYDFQSGTPLVKFQRPSHIARSGIEDLKVDLQGQTGTAIDIEGCDSCWVKGVDVGNGGSYMIFLLGTVNMEIRDSFVHNGGTGPNHSGICFMASYTYGGNSSARVENNIINSAFPNIELNNDTQGIYVGYNFSPGSNGGGANGVSWNFDDSHGGFSLMNLYEGNVVDMIGMDAYFGGSAYGTLLRNHVTGHNPNFNAGGDAIQLKRWAYNYSVVGNVLGTTSQNPTGYGNGCATTAAIYQLGYPNIGNCGTTSWDGASTPGGYPDTRVASSLLRWGNYDRFNNTVRFVAAEVAPGGNVEGGSVAVPSDQTIPASYVYSSQPTWWPQSTPWPPIGPDVTNGDGDASGYVFKIPAQRCWEVLGLASGGAFDPAACYGVASARPSAPRSLNVR